ncbi:MAG: hypothetical protein J0H08_07425 [Rhizobiales bacterium]|nr:hypothetical protein [Hyphomicrobiales bacterium]
MLGLNMRLVGLLYAATAWIAPVSGALACPLCFSGLVITPGQKLDSADEAVLAVAIGNGVFRVVDVVKGDVDPAALITDPVITAGVVGPLTSAEVEPVPADGPGAAEGVVPWLLVRNGLTEEWTGLGTVHARFAPWLRAVAATSHGGTEQRAETWPQTVVSWSSLSESNWRERLVLIAPQLESSEPLVAALSYGELSRAPYGVMRGLKPALDPAAIAAWVEDPGLAERKPGYLLLLGIAGGDNAARIVATDIDAALRTAEAGGLATLLAAYLELHGADGVRWVEDAFFRDPSLGLQEIEAARLALSVHGAADGAVRRGRVVEAYRVFIAAHPPMAGFVAQDLESWQAWEATPDFVAVVEAGAVKDPAGQFAIAGFLRSSPDPSARHALGVIVGAGK